MIAEKLRAIADNMQAIHAACHSRHYAAVIVGNGTTELTIPLPFEPDLLIISNNDPDIRMKQGIVAFAQMDLSALGQLAGICCITSGPTTGTRLGTYTNALMSSAGIPTRCWKNSDGSVTVGNLTYDNMVGVWEEGLEYVVTAVKCIQKTDKERITELIMGLPEGKKYQIYICQAKKEAAFTDEEWKALIANRATYTFVMT